MKKELIKKISISTILLSVSILLSYVEALFPFAIYGVGIKIGLANITTLLGFRYIGVKRTLIIGILRVLIIGVLFGNLLRFTLSVSGFFLSFFIMLIFYKIFNFHIITISILGSISHNLAQIISLIIFLDNKMILSFIPVFTLIGIVTGLVIGIISQKIIFINSKLNI